MSNEEITLTAGSAQATVHPANGARVASLQVDGVELLRQGEKFGCFPMVPWCGRIRAGQFRNGGTTHQMPLNGDRTAGVGTILSGKRLSQFAKIR